MPDLSTLLIDAAPRPASAPDVDALWQSGRRRRTGRRAMGLLSATVLLVAGLGTASVLTDPTVRFAEGGAGAEDSGGTLSDAAVPAEGGLRIGALLPMTGDLADLGPAMRAAAELAVEDLNAAGGVLGGPVELVVTDSADGWDNEVAMGTAVAQLIAGQVTAVVGPVHGAGTSAGAVRQLAAAGVLVLSPSATGPAFGDEGDGLVGRLAVPESLQGLALAEAIAESGATRVAVIARDDAYGRQLGAELRSGLDAAGVEVAVELGYPDDPSATVIPDRVAAAAAVQPDAVVLLGFHEAGAFLEEMSHQGMGPDSVAVWGGNHLGGDGGPPAAAAGVRGVRPAAPDDAAFAARLVAARPDLLETSFAAATYDAVITVALSASAAGTNDARAIADGLAGLTRPGAEPCSEVADCLALLAGGAGITYDGAQGVADLGEGMEPVSGVFEIFLISADGTQPAVATVGVSRR